VAASPLSSSADPSPFSQDRRLLISSQRSTSRPAHARFRTDGAVRIVMVLIINDVSFSAAHLVMFESAQMCSGVL
jgi:hypothetical protein